MAEAIAEAAISTCLKAVTSVVKETVHLIGNAKPDLDKLESKLGSIGRAIREADRLPFLSNEQVKDWVQDLKDVVYDAQDIIEGYRTSIQLNGKGQSAPRNKIRRSWVDACSSSMQDVSDSYQLGNQIKNINERLNQIDKRRNTMSLNIPRATTQRTTGDPESGARVNERETTSLIGPQGTIGRETDKKVIIEKLLLESNVSVISIVGQGGIGKTTLAKMVFNEVEKEFGGHSWWVCVSQKPNPRDLVQTILEKVIGPQGNDPLPRDLDGLCTQLRSGLSQKKFLLVLDDVWDLAWWEHIETTVLAVGAAGSKVLITTRKKDVSSEVNATYMHTLEPFSWDESWRLFLQRALKDGQTVKNLLLQNLLDIGKRIVKKCGGVPLVIQTVGCLMRSKNTSSAEWKSVEDSEIWEWKKPSSSSSYGDIVPALVLSFDDLSPQLKNCFVYCSIFPKNYVIGNDELVMQWVAHGLVEDGDRIESEVRANNYLNDLIGRCMIEKARDDGAVKMHDIMHDLALYIGGKEYNHDSLTEHTRHLFVADTQESCLSGNTESALKATDKLRTLLFSRDFRIESITGFEDRFKRLRVLSLRRQRFTRELPNSIGDLPLLKCLDLTNSAVRRLPTSIGKLHNLQTLNLNQSEIEELTSDIGQLCNLRYLGLEDTKSLTFVAEGLGKLTQLRTLHKFLVCDNRENIKGCNIKELRGLNKLMGSLSIEGLGGLMVKETDAQEAQLKEKLGLIVLRLKFRMPHGIIAAGGSEQSRILEALQPPRSLEELEIWGYRGEVMPTWLLETNCANVRILRVIECQSLKMQLNMPALETLEVRQCDGLNTIDGMPSLKSLKVKGCGGLKMLSNMHALESLKVEGCKDLNTIDGMPSLKSLMVEECGSLKTLSNMPAVESLRVSYGCDGLNTIDGMLSLKFLAVTKCGGLWTLSNMHSLESSEVVGCDGLNTIDGMPSLKLLAVMKCGGLKMLSNMHSLESLEVAGCDDLNTIDGMPSLKSLQAIRCGEMKMLSNMHLLESLDVHECDALNTIDGVPFLKSLKVWFCRGLKTLSNMPALESLEVRGCGGVNTIDGMPSLKSLQVIRCGEMKTLSNMHSLESLEVKECHGLSTIDGMPSLKSFTVEECGSLKTLSNMLALKSYVVGE